MRPILLADDDANHSYITTRAFKEAGVGNALVVVADGNAAVDYLGASGAYADRAAHALPCLVVLDQQLPGRSGLDVLEWVRRQSSLCTLPVLILSSSTFDADVQTAYLLGANGYMVKPASFEGTVAMARAIKDYWLTVNRAPGPA